MTAQEAYHGLVNYSGFLEPFLKGEVGYYKKWHKTHYEIMLQQDLIDLTAVREIKLIKLLAQILQKRICKSVNYANLATDLQVSPVSVKNWIEILENMYMIFKITPYHHNIARSILKEPKIYCYDTAIASDIGAKLENLVALSLMKYLHYLEDSQGSDIALHYCRTKDGREIDFLVKIDHKIFLIEVKTSDSDISKHFDYFSKYFNNPVCFQLVKNLKKEYSNEKNYKVMDLVNWLANIDKYLR